MAQNQEKNRLYFRLSKFKKNYFNYNMNIIYQIISSIVTYNSQKL
jgi:hypothetical protein